MSSTSNYTTGSTPCLPGRNVQFSNLHVCQDGDVEGNLQVNTINNLPYPPGGGFLPTPVPNKVLRTNGLSVISWGDVNPSNLTGGAVGDVLKTVAPGTVAWDPVKPGDITPGTASQIMHTNLAGTAAEWTTDLTIPGNCEIVGTLLVDGIITGNSSMNITDDLEVINGNLVIQTGGADIAGPVNIGSDLQMNGNSGTSGQYLVKTGPSSQDWVDLSVPPSSLTPGTNGQVLTTVGITPTWSDDINLPGLLNVTGGTTLQSTLITGGASTFIGTSSFVGQLTTNNGAVLQGTTNIVNDLRLNGNPGTTGQFLKKTGVSTQAFSNIVASDITPGANFSLLTTSAGVSSWVIPQQIKNIIYGTTFTAQNLNAGAGPTAVSFNTSPFTSITASNTTSLVGISQPSATQFTIGDLALYQVEICGYINPASTGLGNSIITLSAEVNGVEQSNSCVTCSGNYSFTGTISGLSISAASTLRILVRRVVGTNQLNTFASGTGAPSFSSTIVIRSMN